MLSRDETPTPFVIELRVPLNIPTPVLIGSDDIVLSVTASSGKGKSVSTDKNAGLILSERPDVFKFNDLVDSFERASSGGYVRLYKNDKNGGEVWELV